MKFVLFMILLLGTACLVFLSGFVLPTVVALTLLVLAVSADFLTTYLCYQRKGTEGNPIMAVLHKKIGLRSSFIVMAGVWTLIIIFRFMPAVEGVQTAIAIAYWWVPLNNLQVLRRLTKQVHAV